MKCHQLCINLFYIPSIEDFERHCYKSREDHEPATISDIESEARRVINSANAELDKEVYIIIRNKADAEYKARIAKQRAEED